MSEINLQAILYWIADNSDNTEEMEKINKATFPFTSRYAQYQKPAAPKRTTKPSDPVEDIDEELLELW